MAKENKLLIGIYNDYYGSLLTPLQNSMVGMYYNEDLSLSEIANVYSVSRQSVRDTINRASEQLINYEEKLKLVDKTTRIKQELKKLDHDSVVQKIKNIMEE